MVGYKLWGMGMRDVIERYLVNVGSERKSSGENWVADIDLLQKQVQWPAEYRQTALFTVK